MTPALVAAGLLVSTVALEDRLGWYSPVPGTELRLTLVRFTLVGVTAFTLAYGFHRLRTARSAVIDVVGDLAYDVPHHDLEAALARSTWRSRADRVPHDRGLAEGYTFQEGAHRVRQPTHRVARDSRKLAFAATRPTFETRGIGTPDNGPVAELARILASVNKGIRQLAGR